MKKIYLLGILLTSLITYSQTTVSFDTDSNWTTTGSGYGAHSYSEGLFSFVSNNSLRESAGTQNAFPKTFGTRSVRLQNNSSSSLTMTIASGGVADFSVKVRRWDNSPSPDFNLEYSTDGTTWNNIATINNTSLSDSSDWTTFNGTINSINNNILVRIASNGTTERIMVDDFTWNAFTLSTQTLEKEQFSIYPNPVTNGIVNIKTTSNTVIEAAVFNVLGKQVLSSTVNNNTLDVSNLNSGIYILQLNQNGTSTTKKLVIK